MEQGENITDKYIQQIHDKMKEEHEQKGIEEKIKIKDEKTLKFINLKEDSEKTIELFEATDKLDKQEENKAKNLQLSVRVEILRKQLYSSLKHFPKHERYALTQNIKNTLIEMSAELERARYVPQVRLDCLKTVQQNLYRLNTMIDIARDARYISHNYYNVLLVRTTEISKMLVGYIKYAANTKNKVKGK